MTKQINYSLPCISVTYKNGTYKATHKRNNEKTYRKNKPTDFELSEFMNARTVAEDLINSWDLVSNDGWELIGSGHDADKWYFIATTKQFSKEL